MDFSNIEQRIEAHLMAQTPLVPLLGQVIKETAHVNGKRNAFNRLPKMEKRTHEQLADRSGLTDEQWRWAVAFREVLGVGDQFYEWANGTRKRSLEHHHKELAKHDTPKGRKAAKVVSKMMELAIEGRVAPSKRPIPPLPFIAGLSPTGRMKSQNMPSMRNITMGSPVDVLRGVTATKAFIDDHDDHVDAYPPKWMLRMAGLTP